MTRILELTGCALALQIAGCAGASVDNSNNATGGSYGTTQGSSTGGSSGTLGTSNTGGDGATKTCDPPGCCAPLQFDASRSRAYLVDGQLALYLVVNAPDGKTTPVEFDAQVSSSGGITATCTGSYSPVGSGFGYVECPAIAAADLACGAEVSIQVRLRGAQTDSSTFAPLCDQVPFGPSVAWNPTVVCPSCPSEYVSYGASCDHPSISYCGNPVHDTLHCGTATFLPCRCMTSSTGERFWSCAIC